MRNMAPDLVVFGEKADRIGNVVELRRAGAEELPSR